MKNSQMIKEQGALRFIASFLILLIFISSSAVRVFAEDNDTKDDIEISVSRTEYEYSPDGISAEFTCEPEKYYKDAVLEFVNVDDPSEKISAAPDGKAVLSSGNYLLNITIEESEKNGKAVAQASVTVKPATVSIVTPYNKAAYTDMDNPPEYYLEPGWASDMIELETEYYLVADLSVNEYTKVQAPKDIGQYFVKIRPKYDSKDIVCSLKQFVYEIAVSGGNRLSDSEAASPVPSWFIANVESVVTSYNGESIGTKYTVTPAITECELMYRLLLYNDAQSEYTSELPKEPGDYQAVCFASGVMIGDGSVSIEKLDCSITLGDAEVSYDPSGFVPSPLSCTPDELNIKYVAYTVDDQGTPTMEEVPVPITRCGRFFVVASPEDTLHYRNNTAYAYYTINKAVPSFDEKTQYFEYDGEAHAVKITTVPDWIEYDVEYTEIDSKGNVVKSLGNELPRDKGRYMASIIVKASDTVGETTAFIEMKITSGAERLQSREQSGAKDLLGGIDVWSIVLIAVPLAAIIALSVYFFVKSKKV